MEPRSSGLRYQYRNHGFGSYRNRRASSRSFSSSEMAVPASKTMVELLAFMLGIKIYIYIYYIIIEPPQGRYIQSANPMKCLG